MNCLCCSSGCPACVSSHHHTVYTHGSGTCSASSGRGSNGICSKPFINHPLTTPCGFGQCQPPACCREERLQKQHPWEQASAMLVLECKLNAQHKKKWLVEVVNHLCQAVPLLFALESDYSPITYLISFLLS